MERWFAILIGELHGIQHGPEYIEFELEYFQCLLLLISGHEVTQGDIQPMLHIAASF